MDDFAYGAQVEILNTIPCELLAPSRDDHPGMPRNLMVQAGTIAEIRTGDWDVLPGDVAVVIQTPERYRSFGSAYVAVAVRLGSIARVEIEHDPDTGDPAFKVYRGVRVPLRGSSG